MLALPIALLIAVVLTACSGDDVPTLEAPPSAESALTQSESDIVGGAELIFFNDPALGALASPEALAIPPRFRLAERTDREPILTLGLVESAARLTYSSGATNELLAIDILRLEPGVDAAAFFSEFADSLRDFRDLRRVRGVGVVRGVGEAAQHITFTVEGDDGDAVALLRDGMIALAWYRRPAGLLQVVEMGELLQQLDRSLSAR